MFHGKNKSYLLSVGIAVTTIFFGGVYVVANVTVGSEVDPLITKSYFEEQVLPDLQSDVNASAEQEVDRLMTELSEELEILRGQVQSATVGGTGQYEVVTLNKGDSISLTLGTQVLVRSGQGKAVSSENPSFVNVTQGNTLNSGSNLVVNNLYLASATGRSISISSDNTVLMIYGGYVLSK